MTAQQEAAFAAKPEAQYGRGQRNADIDLAAISKNVSLLSQFAAQSKVMAVLKADAYGHGLIPSAEAALRGGADFLGTAVLEEAFALRDAGIEAPVFAWLAAPGADFVTALSKQIDVAAYNIEQLAEIIKASREAGATARIHLKIDTGMWRGGADAATWPQLCAAARRAEANGVVRIVGVWSHLACADEPGHPSIDAQLSNFRRAIAVARDLGLRPELCHIANSAATLSRPDAHFDMVRTGLAVYGINPLPREARTSRMQLHPAMRLSAKIVNVKSAPAGAAVSYGATEKTARATRLAVVPLGYADGVVRSASSRGPVRIGDEHFRVIGRICMDQFVVDVGDYAIQAGDEAVLFGSARDGEPTVEHWAEAAGTIPYEILTGIGARVPRNYRDSISGT